MVRFLSSTHPREISGREHHYARRDLVDLPRVRLHGPARLIGEQIAESVVLIARRTTTASTTSASSVPTNSWRRRWVSAATNLF